ncbi:diacylglycerol kinase zeta-like isoform X7 [Arapaima gigas]
MESLGNEVAGASPILEPPCDGDDAPTSTSSSNSDLPSATEGLRPAGSRRRSTKTFTGLRLFGRSLCSLGSKAFQTQSTSITNYCPVQQAQSHPITEGNGWKWEHMGQHGNEAWHTCMLVDSGLLTVDGIELQPPPSA